MSRTFRRALVWATVAMLSPSLSFAQVCAISCAYQAALASTGPGHERPAIHRLVHHSQFPAPSHRTQTSPCCVTALASVVPDTASTAAASFAIVRWPWMGLDGFLSVSINPPEPIPKRP
jgi:hypothetical protein